MTPDPVSLPSGVAPVDPANPVQEPASSRSRGVGLGQIRNTEGQSLFDIRDQIRAAAHEAMGSDGPRPGLGRAVGQAIRETLTANGFDADAVAEAVRNRPPRGLAFGRGRPFGLSVARVSAPPPPPDVAPEPEVADPPVALPDVQSTSSVKAEVSDDGVDIELDSAIRLGDVSSEVEVDVEIEDGEIEVDLEAEFRSADGTVARFDVELEIEDGEIDIDIDIEGAGSFEADLDAVLTQRDDGYGVVFDLEVELSTGATFTVQLQVAALSGRAPEAALPADPGEAVADGLLANLRPGSLVSATA
ncbi:MAG: hypothetical protein KTR31_41880 [Myxococcales bacterium]|nr:hypothetical protein [Myxococcales bacterium]